MILSKGLRKVSSKVTIDTETIDTETATTASELIHSNRLPCAEDPHMTNSRSSSRITTSRHGSNHSSFCICEPLPPAPGSDNEI